MTMRFFGFFLPLIGVALAVNFRDMPPQLTGKF
jgi:hypothetical protein